MEVINQEAVEVVINSMEEMMREPDLRGFLIKVGEVNVKIKIMVVDTVAEVGVKV